MRKLVSEQLRSASFDPSSDIGWRFGGRCIDKEVNMIRHDFEGNQFPVAFIHQSKNDLLQSFRDILNKYGLTPLGNKDEMIVNRRDGIFGTAVLVVFSRKFSHCLNIVCEMRYNTSYSNSEVIELFRTIPIKAKFSETESLYWEDQCRHANSLINCAIYQVRQAHFAMLTEREAYTPYWCGDRLVNGWKTYRVETNYYQLDKLLKQNPHYKALLAQSAQQILMTVGESLTSYNGLVECYYRGEVDKPQIPRYRKSGGLAAVIFPSQGLSDWNGESLKVGMSLATKPDAADLGEIRLYPPHFIDVDTIREVRIRPCLGEFWVDWIIDDGKETIEQNPNLDYSRAWSFDHGGSNWLTGVSTQGKSLIVDGRKVRSLNQGYNRLVAKYKQGKSEFYWDENLDRIQRKRNAQMRDAINKAARFIINRCLHDGIGNLIIGWNEGQKDGSNMGKKGNQNFVPVPTGRLIERLKQLCPEYGIVLTITEEANTSIASSLDGDTLPKHGEKPATWKASGKRTKRGLYRTSQGWLINADCNGAFNIMRKVATQLGLDLAKVGRGSLTLPQRYDVFNGLKKSYRKRSEASLQSA